MAVLSGVPGRCRLQCRQRDHALTPLLAMAVEVCGVRPAARVIQLGSPQKWRNAVSFLSIAFVLKAGVPVCIIKPVIPSFHINLTFLSQFIF